MSLGKKVAQLRKLRDWTQEELAQKVNVHKSHVSRWESGHMTPRVETLQRLSEIFNVGLEELTGEHSNPVLARDANQMVRDIELLAEDDRMVVRKVIDAMLTKLKMRQALGA